MHIEVKKQESKQNMGMIDTPSTELLLSAYLRPKRKSVGYKRKYGTAGERGGVSERARERGTGGGGIQRLRGSRWERINKKE